MLQRRASGSPALVRERSSSASLTPSATPGREAEFRSAAALGAGPRPAHLSLLLLARPHVRRLGLARLARRAARLSGTDDSSASGSTGSGTCGSALSAGGTGVDMTGPPRVERGSGGPETAQRTMLGA
ncbi:hypothetical protein BJF78_27250 [Pseudonocardia sp. CNS-139]|nr:hypothetical protein BJF78_27250 [Pseudonocardia sp. CNS-139]